MHRCYGFAGEVAGPENGIMVIYRYSAENYLENSLVMIQHQRCMSGMSKSSNHHEDA